MPLDILSPLSLATPFVLQPGTPPPPVVDIAGTWYEPARGIVWTEPVRGTTWIANEDGMATTLIARSGEIANYVDDLSALPELAAGDTIAGVLSVTATALTFMAPALTLGAPSITSGTGGAAKAVGVPVTVSLGAAGCRYRVSTIVLTAGGATKKGVGFLIVSDD